MRYCLSLKKIFLFLGNIWGKTQKVRESFPPSHKRLFLSFFFAFSMCFRPHFRFLEKKISSSSHIHCLYYTILLCEIEREENASKEEVLFSVSSLFFLVGNRCRRLCVFRSCFVCLSQEGGNSFLPIYRQNHLVSLLLYCFQFNALTKSLLKIQMLKVSHIKRNVIQKRLNLPLFFALDYFCGELEQDGPFFSLESRFHFFLPRRC